MVTTAAICWPEAAARKRRADNKVFADVGGRPMIAWSVRAFVGSPHIDVVVVVLRAGEEPRIRSALAVGGVAQDIVLGA